MTSRALLLVIFFAVGLSAQAPVSFQLVQVDRAGAMKPLGRMPPATFAPRISPDGRQVVFDADAAIWVARLDNLSQPRRLATGFYPMWSGDGTPVLFIAGIGEKQLKGGTDYDVWAYSLRDRTSAPLAAKPGALEMGSRLSPDGRWIAYESTESGSRDIFVEPFPANGLRVRVTPGRRPLWSPDGKEIFFDRDDAQLYVIPITLGPSPTVGTATPLPIKGFLQGGARRMYDITPEGKHFLMLFR